MLTWKREPWRKLYIREEGSFAGLPFLARACAAELIKFVDDHGTIPLDGKDPASVVCRRGGAEMGERRIIRRLVDLLLRDGYLVVEDDTLRIRNFVPAQVRWDRVRGEHELATERASVVHEPSASGARVAHESCASRARAVRESCTKSEATQDNSTVSAAPLDPIRNDPKRYTDGAAPPLSLADGTGAGIKPAAPRKRATPMPACWVPDEAGAKRATDLGLVLAAEVADFRDWTSAKGMTYVDWQAAFRSHLASQVRRRPAAGLPTPKPYVMGGGEPLLYDGYTKGKEKQRLEAEAAAKKGGAS